MDKKKVTIELTSDQRQKIKDATGKDLNTLDFEPLEDRDAPSVFGGTKRDFQRIPGKVGDL